MKENLQDADYVRETQYRWEPIDPEPGEGWRLCQMADFNVSGEWCQLWTDAPKDENPHQHNVIWRRHRRIKQERYVSPWTDLGGCES